MSEEINGKNEKIVNYYFYNPSGIFGAVIKGVVYYYVKDFLGNILEIRKASDNSRVAAYEYDAWGNTWVFDEKGEVNSDPDFIGNLNPFRFRGYYYDTDVKLYYLQTRWYDPEIGRFINLDQISYLDPETVNGLNLYAYCGNNPVMGYDPMGTVWWWLVGAIVGAVVGFVSTVIEDFADDGKVFNGSVSAGEYVAKTAFGAGLGAIGGEAIMASGGAGASSLVSKLVGKEVVAISSTAAKTITSVSLGVLLFGWIPGSWPGNDPTVPPDDGFIWRGPGHVGSNRGEWYNPNTGDQLHPDLSHKPPKGPHWGWRNKLLRIFKDIFPPIP